MTRGRKLVQEVGDRKVNAEVLKGKWHRLRGAIRQKWGELTDDDLDYIDGSLERLTGRLQERYGMSQEQSEHEVEDFGNMIA